MWDLTLDIEDHPRRRAASLDLLSHQLFRCLDITHIFCPRCIYARRSSKASAPGRAQALKSLLNKHPNPKYPAYWKKIYSCKARHPGLWFGSRCQMRRSCPHPLRLYHCISDSSLPSFSNSAFFILLSFCSTNVLCSTTSFEVSLDDPSVKYPVTLCFLSRSMDCQRSSVYPTLSYSHNDDSEASCK